MSLEHAILGFLRYKPMSGYDLKKVFDTSVQHFWSADQSQIYRTLGRLADRELVELEVVPQSDRPDRKLYHITPGGERELLQWMAAPVAYEHHRSAALIQVFFAAQLDDDEVLELFEHQVDLIRRHLAELEHIPRYVLAYAQEVDSARDAYFWKSTLELGILSARAALAWLESVIADIRNDNVPKQGVPFTGPDSFLALPPS
jgi:PadR family transcriptional regulator AphA